MGSLLDRYLLRAILATTGLVLFVLLALGGFIDFIAQLDGVGTGTFGVREAIFFVLLRLPQSAFEMLPIAALLGALMGLGALAGHSELVVMRAAGVSIARLAVSTVLAGIVLLILMAALGELVGPPLERFAEQYRTLHKKGSFGGDGVQSAWVKDGPLIVNVQAPQEGAIRGAIHVFELGGDQTLASVGRADAAHLDSGQRWLLENFRESLLTRRPIEARSESRSSRAGGINPELLQLSVVDPDELAARGLYNYIGYLRNNDLDARRYEVALWSRIATLTSVVIMAVLALPFVFGPLRSAGAGARLMVGVLIGAGYFLISKTLVNSSEVFELNPLLIAWLPTLALAVITLVALSRVR
ncbi:MAG: LPS export ABC transporter permease LptG [Gammaproteobacteria bacterium]|nr:LPS export ABC transporter permease LptG [Gammaproteobacteria bacterium]